jgi:hypothetical protein
MTANAGGWCHHHHADRLAHHHDAAVYTNPTASRPPSSVSPPSSSARLTSASSSSLQRRPETCPRRWSLAFSTLSARKPPSLGRPISAPATTTSFLSRIPQHLLHHLPHCSTSPPSNAPLSPLSRLVHPRCVSRSSCSASLRSACVAVGLAIPAQLRPGQLLFPLACSVSRPTIQLSLRCAASAPTGIEFDSPAASGLICRVVCASSHKTLAWKHRRDVNSFIVHSLQSAVSISLVCWIAIDTAPTKRKRFCIHPTSSCALY